MLHRIDPAILHQRRELPLVPDVTLPEPPLPEPRLALVLP
jgi:hypothetical protein